MRILTQPHISTLITKYAEVELQGHWQVSPFHLHSIFSCSLALLQDKYHYFTPHHSVSQFPWSHCLPHHHSVFIGTKRKDKHFPVGTPPEFGVGRHSHRSNFSGLTDDVIAQYSLFLTLLTLSDGLLPVWLSLPSFCKHCISCLQLSFIASPSLCVSCNQPLLFFCHIMQRQIHTLKLKNQDRSHGAKKITSTILLYLCLFSPSHLSDSSDYKHSLRSIVKVLVHCKEIFSKISCEN